MISWRRGLAVLCVVSVLLLITGNIVWQFNEDAAGKVFNYAADPGVLASLTLVTLANVMHSLRVRNEGGSHLAQLPRDVITALVAMFALRYLLQFVQEMHPDRDPVGWLWDYLASIAVVVLAFEAISLWRAAGREGRR